MKTQLRASALHALALFLLASATSALARSADAQEGRPVHFAGVLNDYSPGNVKGGPWEMHGQWSVDLQPGRDTADFYADMTMSDYGATATGAPDATQAGQNAHTHHIRLTRVRVVWDMIGCPVVSPPTTKGFQFKGTVSLITGNGGAAPFETTPPTSTLQVCVTGGIDVPYSNLSMVFGGPATTHFGTQAVHGVVRKVVDEPVRRGW